MSRVCPARCLSALLAAVSIFAQDPFAAKDKVHVLLFVRGDCPITNRYAPELRRIAREFEARPVDFWLIYPDRAETAKTIASHAAEYQLPGEPMLDPGRRLTKRAEATTAPQAAVFDHAGRLVYSGRIDDRYLAPGKSRSAAQTHDLEAAIEATLGGRAVSVPRTRAIGCYLADVQ